MQIPYLSFRLRFPFFTLNLFLPFLFVSTFAFSPLSYLFNVYIYIYKTLVLPSPLILSLTLSFFFHWYTGYLYFSFFPLFFLDKRFPGFVGSRARESFLKASFQSWHGLSLQLRASSCIHMYVYIYTYTYTHIYFFIYSRKIYIQPREGMGMKNGLEEPTWCQKKKMNENRPSSRGAKIKQVMYFATK